MTFFPEVVIMYERKVRDLYNSYLLKYELEKRGICAWVCHVSFRHTWCFRLFLKPKLVVSICALTTEITPSWNVIDQHSTFLRGQPVYYINLQAEQIFCDEDSKYNVVTDEKYKNFIYYVCWGTRRKQQLMKAGIPEKFLWETGALQMDFCRPNFSELFLIKDEVARKYGINGNRKWALFISSFPYVTYSDEELLWAEKVKSDSKEPGNAIDEFELRKIAQKNYNTILDWISKMLDTSDLVFIYRPHPGEQKTEKINKLLSKYSEQFFYIPELSIHQWISVCEVIDTWVSTAYAEALFMGKKCNIIQPYEVPKSFEPVFYNVCEKVVSFQDFKKVHFEECMDELDKQKYGWNYFYAIKEEPAYVSICNNIESLLYHTQACTSLQIRKVIKHLLSKTYFIELYASFALTYRIRISPKLFLGSEKLFKFNEKLKPGGSIYTDCFVTKEDKEVIRKIKKMVQL